MALRQPAAIVALTCPGPIPVTQGVSRSLQKTIARASAELSLLVRRAAREGELEIAEIIDAYVQLQPSGHPHLENPRKISIETLSDTLQRLPVHFTEVDEVRLVRSLSGFEHRPIPGSGWPAGLSEDGALLIELADGVHSLMGFAATICALAVEWSKIDALVGHEDVPPEDDLFAEWESDGTEEQHDAGLEDSDAEPAPDEPSIPDLSELAFNLGITEKELVDASAATRGVLFELLGRPVELPLLRIHADLAAEEVERQGGAVGRQMGEVIAEAGLSGRPIHLWIGGEVVTDCLSPYGRELREPLVSWARQNPDALGVDLGPLPSLVDESRVYAIMRDFFRRDERVLEERRAADQTVGIQRFAIDGVRFDLVDLQRIEPHLTDARIVEWELEGAPILLRVERSKGIDEGALLDELLETIGPSLASVTVLLQGTLLQAASPDAIVLPHLMLRWVGEEKVSLPGVRALDPEHFMGLAEPAVTSGAVLSMPTATLLNAQHIEWLAQAYRVSAIEVGGAGLIATLHDALWTGRIDADVPIAWALVDHARVHGRPSVAALTASSAVAIALLRRIGAAPLPPEPEPEPEPKPRGPSRTAMRIRA